MSISAPGSKALMGVGEQRIADTLQSALTRQMWQFILEMKM